ncbi:unnamed protein product [marine sediment metagenome]|uniref:Uncharacterized protein n=1 Tax=marine sediment metagenome TaxID=412755 RepID=X0XB66_9ZZZZ
MWMIEGTWSGYTSSQQKIQHREYVSQSKSGNAFVEQVRALGYGIRYTDGTMLVLRIAKVPRRKLRAMDGYGKLIRECIAQGVTSVADLPPA